MCSNSSDSVPPLGRVLHRILCLGGYVKMMKHLDDGISCRIASRIPFFNWCYWFRGMSWISSSQKPALRLWFLSTRSRAGLQNCNYPFYNVNSVTCWVVVCYHSIVLHGLIIMCLYTICMMESCSSSIGCFTVATINYFSLTGVFVVIPSVNIDES